jgi:hypothetical protein
LGIKIGFTNVDYTIVGAEWCLHAGLRLRESSRQQDISFRKGVLPQEQALRMLFCLLVFGDYRTI